MLKRLIEVALPLKEVSEQSAREKSIRHGHISTLHIWWARRPLAACRAAVFASLIPDPDDHPECPDHFRALVIETLDRTEFKPKNGDGSAVEDTPRNRCLEFIKQLVKWENSNNPMYIEPARELIAAAHKFLHPDAESDAPKVLDPFAGGGAIPLEALRLGCEAHAIDINPVAHLIELCTLVYPQKYGQPNSRPVPDYIKRLIAHNKAKKRAKGEQGLFDEGEAASASDSDGIVPDVEITEKEYRKNPLSADVSYWSEYVAQVAKAKLDSLYPLDPDGAVLLSFHWVRTFVCTNPTCGRTVPLIGSFWLSSKGKDHFALSMEPKKGSKTGIAFSVYRPRNTKDVDNGTLGRTTAECPSCGTVVSKDDLQRIGNSQGFGYQLVAVGCRSSVSDGRRRFYRPVTPRDHATLKEAKAWLAQLENEGIPDADLPYLRSIFNLHVYGYNKWRQMFNPRQLVVMSTFCRAVADTEERIRSYHTQEYAEAVTHYLGVTLDRMLSRYSNFCIWDHTTQCVMQVFNQGQSLPMRFDYVEMNPLNSSGSGWATCISYVRKVLDHLVQSGSPCNVQRGDATRCPLADHTLNAVITDPPYYDSVPYADCSDYFYIWLQKSLGGASPWLFSTPLTPKASEIAQLAERNPKYKARTKEWFEQRLADSLSDARRMTSTSGIIVVMYAHKTTAAWEALIRSILDGGLYVTGSWPLHTESKNRLRASNSAALASSVTFVCRPRLSAVREDLWDDVRQELKSVAQERLDFFWDQGIRGADFFISAIGPALSVFGKYERVTKLSGEEVTVGQFLDEVRGLVTTYALAKILKATHTGAIDPESRFYVVWKWSYRDSKVPADESFKLSQALGFDTASLWDRTGVLEKSGENVQASTISKRIKIKNLGEPSADGTPASLVDVLHRMCAFREKNDTQGMGEFLGRSGHANNNSLWLVAQAVSEILPDGDKEKQLMQGLLNQKEGLEEAAREGRLF